jgi:hypothetical protein
LNREGKLFHLIYEPQQQKKLLTQLIGLTGFNEQPPLLNKGHISKLQLMNVTDIDGQEILGRFSSIEHVSAR